MKRLLLFITLFSFVIAGYSQSKEDLQNSYNFKRGQELLFGSNPDQSTALDFFKKELAEHPNNGYALYCMGLIYDDNDQEGEALDCFNKAVPLLKKDKNWISYAYRLRAKVNLKLGNDELALKDWKASLKENPTDENTLSDRAEFYYYQGEYELADADYDVLISSQPGNTLGYLGKGRNAIMKKQYDEALRLFNYSITLDPKSSQAYAFRAETYLALNKNNEAADDLITALSIDYNRKAVGMLQDIKSPAKEILLAKLRIQQAKDKNNALWSFLQGGIYEEADEYENAIKAYEAANNISTSSSVIFRLSLCHSELGEYNEALDYVNRSLAMDSTNTSYLLCKANYLYELGKTKAALNVLTSFIDKEPDEFFGYYRRGFFKYCTDDFDGAIEDFTTALVLQPHYTYALVERGECYKHKGNMTAAKADFIKALEESMVRDSVDVNGKAGKSADIDVNDRTNLDYITYDDDCNAQYAYLGLGKKDFAIAVQDSILAHNDDKGSYYDAACLYSKMGEYDKAMGYLRTALEKGFRRFTHIMNDRDLDGLKNRADFKAMMKEFEAKVNDAPSLSVSGYKGSLGDASVSTSAPTKVSEIPFTRESGGLCKVKCNINGLPLNFWLDTGASDVSLSMVEATFMLKNGYLTKDDVVGSSYYLDANGNVSEGTVINLRKVSFGDCELTNVKASVVSNLKAPLLLGQSVLSRLGSVEIDNQKQVLRIKPFQITEGKTAIGVLDVKGNGEPIPVKDSDNGDIEQRVFEVVEQMPSFPGGLNALMNYLSTNIVYPEEAWKKGEEGRVVASFIVETDGSISNVSISRSVSPLLDAEAVRVITAMPKWIPGKNNGKTVRVKFNVPISFKIPKDDSTETK